MPKKSSQNLPMHSADYGSPHSDLVYRALVYARQNDQAALYYVAGVQGGPWSAAHALARSHKCHGGRCFYCSADIKDKSGTIDHVEPIKFGGKSNLQNLVLACKPCNSRKGHLLIDTFNPGAGKQWLEALLLQVQERLNRINPASSPPPP